MRIQTRCMYRDIEHTSMSVHTDMEIQRAWRYRDIDNMHVQKYRAYKHERAYRYKHAYRYRDLESISLYAQGYRDIESIHKDIENMHIQRDI